MDESSLQALLREGIAAAKLAQQKPTPAEANPRKKASALLLRVIELDEENISAWLWLSTVVDTREEQQICLENVLMLDPNNKHALAGLARLNSGTPTPAPALAPQPSSAPPPPQPTRSKYNRLKTKTNSQVQPSLTENNTVLRQTPPDQKKVTGPACPFCRQPISGFDKRCPHCQLPLVVTCPACNTGVDVEQKACPACGQSLGNYRQPVNFFAQLGKVYQKSQLYPEAVKAWQVVETLKPDYPHLQLRLGEAHLGTGRPDRAWASLQRAAEQEPETVEVYFALGELARQRGDRPEAFSHYQNAIKLEPKYGLAWFRLGEIYQEVRNQKETSHAYRQALKLLPAGSIEYVQAQTQLERLTPALPESMATGGAELFRQMAGPMALCLLAALMDSGLRPWWIPLSGWLALFLALIGTFLYISGTDLPRNPLIQSFAGERGLVSDEAKFAIATVGAVLWFLALLLILLPLGQAYPEPPTL